MIPLRITPEQKLEPADGAWFVATITNLFIDESNRLWKIVFEDVRDGVELRVRISTDASSLVSVEERTRTLVDAQLKNQLWDIFPLGGRTSSKKRDDIDSKKIYDVDNDFGIVLRGED